MPQTPPQTDTYNTALDIFDRTHPLRVDADENLKVTIAGGSVSSDVNIHDSAGNSLSSTGTSLNVNVTDFPAVQAVSQSGAWTVSLTSESIEIGTVDQGTAGSDPWLVDVSNTISATITNFPAVQAVSQNGTWTTGRTWALSNGTDSVNVGNFPATVAVTQSTSPWVVSGTINAAQSGTWTVQQGTPPWSVSVTNFPATQPVSGTVTALQGTSPWVVSGTVTTSPNVNIHDSAGNSLSSTGTSLDANITNFPATVAVTQSTSPWVVSGTVTANAGTGNFTVVQATGTNLHAVIDSGNVAVSQSGTWSVGRTWALSNSTDSVAAVQSGSWTVAGTGNFTVVQPTGTNLHTVLDSGTLTSITNALPAGTNVIGHVIADSGSTTAVTGNVTVVQPTGTNLHTVVDSGSITVNNTAGASAVNIQDGGNSITVDGTVTANAGTGTFQENVAQFGGTNVVTGTGASGAGIPRVTVSNDSNVLATQSGTWTVQPGNTPNTAPWLIEQRAPGIATYSASALGLVAAATPTDIFTIYGSGTKTIKIVYIQISATQNTAAIRDVVLIKRSATNTGGTSSSVTAVPYDSSNAAATATVLAYTANPASLGTSVGNVRTAKFDIPATNLVGSTDRIEWTFGERPSQAVVLRGTSQGLAVNLNSVTSTNNSFDIVVEWTEE